MQKDLSPCLRRSSRSPVTNRRAIFDPPLLEGMVRRRVANPFVQQRADVSRGCSLSRSSLDTIGYVARHLSSVRATPPNHPARKGSAFLIRSRIALPGWFLSSLEFEESNSFIKRLLVFLCVEKKKRRKLSSI